MIGGQHTKERLSERLAGCQNQPKNRGYLLGTKLMTGGYSTSTLQGNWFEERADASYYDGQSVFPMNLARIWTTEYRTMTGNIKELATKPVFDQTTMVDIVDHRHRAYPSHQPHLDTQREALMQEQFKTTMKETYMEPNETKWKEETYVPPVVGRTPTAQAKAVILRFRHQLLLSRQGQSAFPGNVLRQFRLALWRNDTSGDGTLTVEEAHRAFTEARVAASLPECMALVRTYDVKDNKKTSIDKIVEEMRGELRDRRYSVVEKVYEMLKKLCSDGIVRIRHLADLVDVSSMDAVANGTVTSHAAHDAFVEQWDLPADAYISFETFLSFFMDASFEVDSDQAFEVLMRNVWHLSGGNEKLMNTSCRRVRVVHTTGRITTQEVKNDLDIKDSDPNMMERIIANLAAQGVKDISKVEVLPKQRVAAADAVVISSTSSTQQQGRAGDVKESFEPKQIFMEKFRERLANDTTGKNTLDGFLGLPEGLSPTAASIGPLKRGEEPLPPWIKLKVPKGISQRPRFNKIRRSMREKGLSTVCEEAKCPNIGECWGGDEEEGSATATIMVMGSHCTRGCRFCSVLTSRTPPPLDPTEPQKVSDAVAEMGVDYIVMTMVDRDDLEDGGAAHVVRCIEAIKQKSPQLLLEALVGDFHGDLNLVEKVATSPLNVYAHNIECVERITPNVRDRRATYRQSLKTLEHVSSLTKGAMLTKSSIMLGLGEREEEVRQTLRDLRTAGVSAVTLGQYLQPARTRLKVSRYAHPKEFEMWEEEALAMGFLYCASGPMVRSSYRAGEYYIKSIIKRREVAVTAHSGGGGGSSSSNSSTNSDDNSSGRTSDENMQLN